MITMTMRPVPLLLTAASGLLAAVVAVVPLLADRPTAVDAVPAPAVSAAAQPLATQVPGDRTSDQVSRELDRPVLVERADARVAAQAQLSVAVATEKERLDAAAAQAAAAAAAAEAARVAAELEASRGYTGTPREIARQMAAAEYGWGEQQFQCYDNIIMRESEWVITATNPSSGAYGIPQALPAEKLAAAGDDWRTNPVTQITWGLDYIEERYGTPCDAWSFKQSVGWY